MAINDLTPPEPTRLTMMDRAVGLYHSFGEDFVELLDHHISCFPEAKRYVHVGPGFFILFHEEDRADPMVQGSEKTDPYWYVSYAAADGGNGVLDFLRFMPYKLDRVGFHRYAKYSQRGITLLSTDKLLKRYGKQTETTPTSAATTSTASTPCSCGQAANQAGEEGCEGCKSNSPTTQVG